MAVDQVRRLRGAGRLRGRSCSAVSACPGAPGDPGLSLLRQEARAQYAIAWPISEITQGGAGRRDILPRQLPDTPGPGPVAEKITGPGGYATKQYRRRGSLPLPPTHGTTHHRQRQEHDRWVN